MKLIDLSYIKLIKEKDKEYLADAKNLEFELLPALGLNNESLQEFPEELYSFCGYGLLHWQYPNQFSKYLAQLSKFNIKTYLEIGVRHGGTFVLTVEYLEKFHSIEQATGVDIGYCPSIVEYKKLNPKIDFMMAYSQSPEFGEFIKNHPGLDLVLIDGNHKEAACRNDFEVIKNKANIVVFHDIVSDVCPGVGRVWRHVVDTYSGEYVFFEYTEQYDSVQKRTNQTYLGIGMAVKKKYLQEIGYQEIPEAPK